MLFLQQKESEESKLLDNEAKGMEKLLNKKSVLTQKREECKRKIAELGSLPADAFAKYAFPHLAEACPC